ncbi:MAG: DNA polymerase III subunit gamma/tau [Methylotenera sp.]|nr:DNA polymerase III subunit gamma/tau [Oligoflexia bacterium]
MASYVVLARKWRPSQFSDIVGQGHIVRTLMNAIRSERLHQAYLLTGSRGIGKTSIARIFAKAIRCENVEVKKSPDGSDWLYSCDHCPACREIAAGNSVDVIEIDGASNNGVDAVREIRENAKYLPSSGGKKIYIIDEVHMLTTAAFNALLKTLEEPPPHVIFVLATTEPHKIPATILSRCQRFDLRRVTLAQMQTRLIEVTQKEGIQAEAGGLALIARAAEGSMRDALSLLDQVIAFAGNQVSTQAVRESVGLIAGQTLLGILSGVFARKPLDAIALVDQAYQQGHDLKLLTRNLIEFLHGAILAKLGAAGSATLELSEDEWKELTKIAALRSIEEIELIFQVLHQGIDWIARSPQPKIVLDVLLIKCATAEALVHAQDLGGAGNSSPGGSTASGSGLTTNAASPAVPQRTLQAQGVITPSSIIGTIVAPTASASTPAQSAQPAATPVASVPGVMSWEGFIGHVRPTRPLLASILEHANVETLPLPTAKDPEFNVLTICLKPEDAYYKEQLQSKAYSEQLLALTKDYFKRLVRIAVELKAGGESLAAKKERERKERETTARNAAQNHPIISEARALFGGEMGPIEFSNGTEPEEGGGRNAKS